MRALVTVLLLSTPLLAGCFGADDPPASQTTEPPTTTLARLDGGRLLLDVPVPVFLVGFDDATATDLAERLDTMQLTFGTIATTAQFEVHVPSDSWQADFDAFLATAIHPGNADLTGFTGTVLDGNAIEAYLAKHLIQDVPTGINSLVVLDPGIRGHAYHYEGDVGWREPVRSFGERSPVLVWDPHAAVDPWVGDVLMHHVPVNEASVDLIAQWVERATAIRALQMPIWPPATSLCHAVTIILAVRGTSVTPTALGLQTWDEALDTERLQATFQNMTGDPVHVDLVIKQLPVDDPPLEAITRENSARTITQTYLDTNFEQYHVPHDGCEPYLSLVVYGDLGDQRTQSNGNAAMLASGRRISTSLVAENVRIMSEVVGYNDVWDESTTFERVGPGADPLEWFNWVVSHETGHLFSLPHPNYATGPSYSDTGFASTWNVMGYQMRRIVTEMSQIDANNMQRHQAAYAVLGSSAPEETIDDALLLMGEYRWKDATRLVQAKAT